MFILPHDTVMTPETLTEFLAKHKAECARYERLRNLYIGDHPILHQPAKEAYKPDERLVVNYAKYITDTFNGYFIGIPIKVSHEQSTEIAAYLEFLDQYNNQDDNNAELSKMMSIFGRAFELLYMDEYANVGITYVSPLECFVIYDESIVKRPLFGIRVFVNTQGETEGSFSSGTQITYFRQGKDGIVFDDIVPHYFGDVPIIEYRENEECIGVFEGVETLINNYNKSLSEKANDVDYYADAYLKVIGALLDEASLKKLRDSRIINMEAPSGGDIDIDFLAKPESDGTQENLLNRLEQRIFQIAMVANISDENFGVSSGKALEYKLLGMSNLAHTKQRKFESGLNRRYKLISNLPNSKIPGDEWMKIKFQFTRNTPANLLEESQIVKNLLGIVSKQTLLKILSVVSDVRAEIARIDEEKKSEIDSLFLGGGEDHGTEVDGG